MQNPMHCTRDGCIAHKVPFCQHQGLNPRLSNDKSSVPPGGSGHLWKMVLRDAMVILHSLKSASFRPLLNSPKSLEYIEIYTWGGRTFLPVATSSKNCLQRQGEQLLETHGNMIAIAHTCTTNNTSTGKSDLGYGCTQWATGGIGPKCNCSKMVHKSFVRGLGNTAGAFRIAHQALAADHWIIAGSRCHRIIANVTPSDCG